VPPGGIENEDTGGKKYVQPVATTCPIGRVSKPGFTRRLLARAGPAASTKPAARVTSAKVEVVSFDLSFGFRKTRRLAAEEFIAFFIGAHVDPFPAKT